eukprot:6886329-Pyramimonas_sp.AAC.1
MRRSLMIFLPKGTVSRHQAGQATRHPSCTRPLSMPNTDVKLLSGAMRCALTSNSASPSPMSR